MKFAITLFMIAAVLPLPAYAGLSTDDTTYVTSAIQSQLGRYALASLALKSASSPQIKNLAKSMTAQSTAANRTLTSIAKANGVPVPASASVRDNYHYSSLSGLHGKAFDQQFVQVLSTDDQLVLSTHQTEMRSGGDSRLKAFAKSRYHELQKELQVLGKIH
jgi:predicted outer membrane protein